MIAPPQIPQINPQQFNIYYIILLIILSYVLRIVYIKYIKPRIENGERPKLRFNLRGVLQHIEALVKLMLYSMAFVIAYLTITISQQLPDTTVEVPLKILFLQNTLFILYTIVMFSFLFRGNEG